MEYDLIICFETHVELNTKTKLFCDCLVSYDAPPNSHICPVCTGQPGTLPVLNKKAVEFTVKAGLAFNCTINRLSRFARKNYFYPDLPKGYQISQYERPFCEDGHLEIIGDDGQKYAVGIKRIHLEEDAGKLVHSSDSLGASQFSLVDYNRSSVPLLEIVNDHENNPIRSIAEARAYLEKLRQALRYIEISECMLERGQFRCDVNISVRPRGSSQLGNRAEIKNMSSYKFIMDALEYEMKRQTDILESGGRVDQETRLFDEVKGITLPMRSKEDAPDYRYFPDPDLMEVQIDQELIDKMQKEMPDLPDHQMKMIIRDFGIAKNDAIILTRDRAVSEYFRQCASLCEDKRRLANWIIKELFKLLNEASRTIDRCLIIPEDFARLISLISSREITESIGRTVLGEMFKTGKDPETIIEGKALKTISNDKLLKAILEEIIAKNPEAVNQIKAGESRPVDFLIGKVMKKTKGKADPKKIRKMILRILTG